MAYDDEDGAFPLPPDVQKAIDAAKAERAFMHSLEVEQRETVLANAWLLCTCRPWPEREDGQLNVTPPQAGCIVHGSVMVTLDGRVL